MFETPILFIIFNRPELTKQVFQEIKKQKPKFLFIAADGPRKHIKEDINKCMKTKELVLKGIDWDCEVKTLFREENLGCGKGVSLAIDWFFDHVEEGIILEDDCLPHESFFGYCESLLEKYAENPKIFGINGSNFQLIENKGGSSYFYSNYMFVWGWATWKRAWEHYDFKMKNYEELATVNFFSRIDKRRVFRKYWKSRFDLVHRKELDTWDYQWLFSIWKNQGLIVVPNTNLVSNIGFGHDATHTINQGSFANLGTYQIKNLNPPHKIRPNTRADRIFSRHVFNIGHKKKGFVRRVRLKLNKIISGWKK